MMKPDSLYNVGMKPLVYSDKLMKYKSYYRFLNRYWMAS